MLEYPQILKNPFDPIYNFEDSEIYSIKETEELISLEKYSYCLFAFWNTVVINIQRRIEKFGINIFLDKAKEEIQYNINANTLKERWLSINEYKIIEYAKKLNLITNVTHDLITSLFWMKSNTNEEENKNLTKQEVLSIIYLIEKNLFLSEFKKDKRVKNPIITNTNMKFRRKEDIRTNDNELPRTYDNLLLRTGVKIFEEQNKKVDEQQIIDKYF